MGPQATKNMTNFSSIAGNVSFGSLNKTWITHFHEILIWWLTNLMYASKNAKGERKQHGPIKQY